MLTKKKKNKKYDVKTIKNIKREERADNKIIDAGNNNNGIIILATLFSTS